MKFKLTYLQFFALFNILSNVVDTHKPEDMEDKLLNVIIAGLYKKFFKMTIEKKLRYLISFSPQEAIAFSILLTDHPFHVSSYEGNLLNQCIARINLLYSKPLNNDTRKLRSVHI